MFQSRMLLLLTLISSSSIKMIHSIPTLKGAFGDIKRSKYKALKNFITTRFLYSLKHTERIQKYIKKFNAESNKLPIDFLDFAMFITHPQRYVHKEAPEHTEEHTEDQEDIVPKKSKKTRKGERKSKK